jgi:GT2 family glycosyltransferase
MSEQKNLNELTDRLQLLRAENAALRVELRQAQDFSIKKEKKSIEYIFHINQFKSRLSNRIETWLANFFSPAQKTKKGQEAGSSRDEDALYADWISKYDAPSEVEREAIARHCESLARQTKFTLILDCRSCDLSIVISSLQSLGDQLYQNLEIIICGAPETLKKIADGFDGDISWADEIKLINAPAGSRFEDLLSHVASVVTGDYVGFLRAGDRLHEAALYEFATEIDLHPQAQALYADHDELGEWERRRHPHFKTDWNLELFLGQDYIGEFCLLSREVFSDKSKKLGVGGSLEALNFYALTSLPRSHIRHIARVLCHYSGSQQSAGTLRRTGRLVGAYFAEIGVGADVAQLPAHSDWVDVRRASLNPQPLVTIIIPTRNRPDLLSVSLRGVLSETNYENIEVIIVDHENDHPDVIKIFKSYSSDARVRLLPYAGVFDHSDMNNRAAAIARGEILLFLNDDIEVIEPDWLTHMIAQFAQADRGVVGARLLYPDDRIQHAGVILGFGGVAGHGFVGLDADAAGYFGRLQLASEVSALTGACMAMRRVLFEEVGGFSARHLQRTFNDVDLCLKARAKGKVNIYTPLATLVHHESATDGGDVKLKHYKRLQGEVGYMLGTWGLMRSDPYYNVNLALEGKSFSLAFPPRRVAPWQAAGVSQVNKQ